MNGKASVTAFETKCEIMEFAIFFCSLSNFLESSI